MQYRCNRRNRSAATPHEAVCAALLRSGDTLPGGGMPSISRIFGNLQAMVDERRHSRLVPARRTLRGESQMQRTARTQRSGRRGASVVEMAIVLPVFMMVVMGIIEFGRGMMVGQLVTNAARYGARLAAIDGSSYSSVE
jgi:hypothetical protein